MYGENDDVEIPTEEVFHTITLEGSLLENVEPRSVCTCGWASDRSSSLISLGNEAKEHAVTTGHKLRRLPLNYIFPQPRPNSV